MLLIIVIGLILKLFFLPGVSALLVLSISITSLFYLALSFLIYKEPNQKTNWKRVLLSIGSGWLISMVLLGILFKVQVWPGSATQFIGGVGGLVIISIIAFIKYRNGRGVFFKNLMTRAIGFALAGMLFYSPAYNLYENAQFRHSPDLLQAIKSNREHPSRENETLVDIEFMRAYRRPNEFIREMERRAQFDSVYQKYYLEELRKQEEGSAPDSTAY